MAGMCFLLHVQPAGATLWFGKWLKLQSLNEFCQGGRAELFPRLSERSEDAMQGSTHVEYLKHFLMELSGWDNLPSL